MQRDAAQAQRTPTGANAGSRSRARNQAERHAQRGYRAATATAGPGARAALEHAAAVPTSKQRRCAALRFGHPKLLKERVLVRASRRAACKHVGSTEDQAEAPRRNAHQGSARGQPRQGAARRQLQGETQQQQQQQQ
eukprot:364213-Chlamydomonas_euryale.AAC.14